ncbi:hypothetical protein COR16_08735 [Campylobacter upsaliensis]|uniref:Uncharacterized protein n=3 Tax=Campylobacter upsaliensis TaxID=28080 RepID=A0A5L8V391_CAMUP|nr:hypothetical protein [Campylobacter upsaliensis]EAH7072744.1 hypothetical protein [Campylobacter upsaliensis]EAH8539882.1 hypothetical protein [Campylobacter upsaliensis]EAI0665643.1 hypothetical protein [Campylobacter upsaliensis]EAI7391074.1 hypothetical protein [Campylobacter upsaliensis]EAI8667881.1 hypothetical protein [Campylobacter upsaliensis]
MIITHPKYYTSEGEITADELVELIENNFHNGHFYENINDFIISIYTNDYNPFTDCEEMPTLLSFSNRYTYGVKELESKEGEIIEINKDNFEDLGEIEAWLIRNDYIFKPFEKYEHSSLHFTLLNSTCTPLQCRFDSSIGGYLVMKKSDLRKARGVKRLNQKLLDDEFKLWQSLLNDFTNYINGWSYELRIENQLKGTLDYFSFTDLEKAVEFALPILNETSEARAS